MTYISYLLFHITDLFGGMESFTLSLPYVKLFAYVQPSHFPEGARCLSYSRFAPTCYIYEKMTPPPCLISKKPIMAFGKFLRTFNFIVEIINAISRVFNRKKTDNNE